MLRLIRILLATLFVHSLCLGAATGQPSSHARSTPLQALNAKAAASDAAGIQAYSYELIDQLVPDEAGKDYINKLADRLARAEEMARAGKGKLVSESAIAHSFDNLMKDIGAPATLKANEMSIRRVREASVSVPSSAPLFSAAKNGTNCYPGESVFLLWILIFNDGQISTSLLKEFEPYAQNGKSFSVFSGHTVNLSQSANMLLSEYASKHGRHATMKLFNSAAQTLGF